MLFPAFHRSAGRILPAGIIDQHTTLTNLAFPSNDAPLWNMALIASRLHLFG